MQQQRGQLLDDEGERVEGPCGVVGIATGRGGGWRGQRRAIAVPRHDDHPNGEGSGRKATQAWRRGEEGLLTGKRGCEW